jgi:hypothetical protein
MIIYFTFFSVVCVCAFVSKPNGGIFYRYYLQVCGNNQASSREKVGGWCEKFRFEEQNDGTWALYTEAGGKKYYLKVCGYRSASSRPDVGGWCEKFLIEPLIQGCDIKAILSGVVSCQTPEK